MHIGLRGHGAVRRKTLAGRGGTRGAPRLTLTVVPDSGTGQLAGLTGAMTIDIVGGKHLYTFEYTLPAAP